MSQPQKSLHPRLMSVVPTTARSWLVIVAAWLVIGFFLELPSSFGLSLYALSHLVFWPLFVAFRALKWVIVVAVIVIVVKMLTHKPTPRSI